VKPQPIVEDIQGPGIEAALLTLLGRLFAGEIDAELLDVLRTEGVREVFEQIEPACIDGIDLEDTAAEYCRLFVLPNGVAPVAGAWLGTDDPDAASAVAGLVQNIEKALELELPKDIPPDHAGTVLPLWGWLMENQPAGVEDFAGIAAAPWLPKFAEALEAGAEIPLYRVAGKLVAAYFADRK